MNRRFGQVFLGACVILLISLTILDMGPLPAWLLGMAYASVNHLDSYQQLQLEQSIRSTVLQAIGGLLLASGAVATWRQVVTASQTLSLSQSTRATDVFARAIDHLGSAALVTRIGAIYTLDRIARDEPTERLRIEALLASFARTPPTDILHDVELDVQAAIVVLGTAQYSSPNLENARLRGAELSETDFSSANFRGAVLSHATLVRANLRNTCLAEADLRGADLRAADLRDADLRDADLWEANLAEARLDDVRFNDQTRWPTADFRP